MKSIARPVPYGKLIGLASIVIGLPIIIIGGQGTEIPLLVGLFITLVTRERTDDERSRSIKMTSLYTAFVISYGIKLLSTNLFEHGLVHVQITDVNHFLILTLSLANIIFYSRMLLVKF